MNLHYESRPCSKMTAEQISQSADLFSQHYGLWSSQTPDPSKRGNRVKMSAQHLQKAIISKPDRYVVLAYDDDKLIGHAFYMKRATQQGQMITWILQLVVAQEYRGNHIGTKLMHSIWKMSDSWAWGLYTADPYTIKVLEDATMRRIQVKYIDQHIDELKSVAYDLFDDMQWIESYSKGIVNTRFYVDHSEGLQKLDSVFPRNHFRLPHDLPEGCEWFAFVFSSQRPVVTHDQMESLLSFSEDIIRNAYSRMNMHTHGWASHGEAEIEFIMQAAGSPKNLLDLGCGTGRHCYLAAERGINAVGIDYANVHENDPNRFTGNPVFVMGDARSVHLRTRFDSAIALYDVIGSSPDESENQKILLNAFRHLKPHGVLVISVMNMNVTRINCQKYAHVIRGVRTNIRKLLRMRSSNTMQKNGIVFDGRYILIDEDTGICYRKEQFFSEHDLPIEYIVMDRRYSISGITRLVRSAGFIVERCYCVKAGQFDRELKPNDPDAKEILVVARKANHLYQVFHRHDYQRCWIE